MKRIHNIIPVFVIASVLTGFCFVQAAQSESKNQNSAKTIQVLFIGNSHTYCNNMPKVLLNMALSARPSVIMQTTQQTPGGCTLERHWQQGKALELIRRGGWDFVVLQENGQISLRNPKNMREYTARFVAEIKKVNAKAVLFMTAAHQDMPEATDTIAKVYKDIAAELNVSVVPVGLAFKRSLKERPELILHNLQDKVHANMYGTYLTACVFYTVLTGQDPNGLSDGGLYSMRPADRQFLQQIAWETVQSYPNKQ
jgi:hypothetical protein